MSNANKKSVTLEEVRQKQFLGHPVGLWALFTTEMWERFCYYGMRALLVLYLISTLTDSNPGFGWTESDASKLYGWFTGLVYLTPLIGGFLADRLLGQHRSVLLGGVLMALGEFCLFFSEYFRQHATATITMYNAPGAYFAFMLGLLLIVVGNGFFKPCISVMVGGLYEKNDPRRDNAFSIFYMGINVGAFLAPFVAGSVGEKISWHWGFLTAGIGMCIGLCTYSFLRPKYLGPIGKLIKNDPQEASESESEATAKNEAEAVSDESKSHDSAETSGKLSRKEIDRIGVILTLTFFCIAFWSVFEQAGTSLNIFAKKETNRQVPAAIGSNLPGFLPNQDQLDASTSMNQFRRDLVTLQRAVDDLQDDVEGSDVEDFKALMKETLEADFEEANSILALIASSASKDDTEEIDELSQALSDVRSSYALTSQILAKANEAGKRAGQNEINLGLDDLETALQVGLAEQAAMEAEIQALYEKRLAELKKNGDVKVDEALEQSVFDFAQKDVRKARQAAFLKAETDKIDKNNAIWTFPTTWYQSVNALCVVLFVPLFNMMWTSLRRRNLEPSTPVKFGIGLVMLSVAFMFMIFGALQSVKTNGNAGAYWLLLTYMFCTFGELCLSPVGLSMVSRLAPPRYASLLMGVWFLSSAVAGYLSGYLTAWLGSGDGDSERVSFFFGADSGLADFFLIMTLVPFLAGVIVFLLAPKLRKMMHEND